MTGRPPGRRRWIRDPALYAGVRAASALINTAGLDASVHALRPMGAAFARSRAGRPGLNKARAHLRRCFPDWHEDRIERVAVDAYRTLFGFAAEFCCAPRVCVAGAGRQLPPRVELGSTRGAVGLLVSGVPAIMITGHCGNWEILGATAASLGARVSALYRPLNQPPIDRWVRRTRAARGLDLVDKFGAAERIQQLAGRGGSLGFIADQNAGNKGIFVPFFGRLTSTYKSIGLVALQQGIPILCGQARRLGGPDAATMRYRVEIEDIIHPGDAQGQPDPLFYVTARYRRAIETMVRRSPEQYLWMHRAWKTRAPHERRGKPMPGALREKFLALPWTTEEDLDRLLEESRRDAESCRRADCPA